MRCARPGGGGERRAQQISTAVYTRTDLIHFSPVKLRCKAIRSAAPRTACPERKRRLQTRASSASARIRGCARRREESACHAACGVAHHSTRAPRRLSAQLVGSNVFVPSTEKRLYSVASCVLTWSMNLARHGRHHRAMGSSPRGHRSNTSPSARCDDTYCSPACAL